MKPRLTTSALFATALLLTGCSSEKVGEVKDENGDAPVPIEAMPSGNAVEPETENEVQSVVAGELHFTPAEQLIKARVGTGEVAFIYTACNRGVKPVRITRVDSGCACIEESVEPELVPPGETATITAIYETGRLSGLAEKVLSIETDQEGVGAAHLMVKLEMQPVYLIDRELTTWKKGERSSTKTVTFETVAETPIAVLEAKSSRPEIDARVEMVVQGREYRIHLTPSSTADNLLGMVRLETDCEIEGHSRPLLYVTIQ